jgi:hypothetical protein
MPESEAPTLIILLSTCTGLLVLLLLLVVRISWRLSRIEKNLTYPSHGPSESPATAPSAAETSPGGAFEAFLSEDPERRNLTKSEQFSAYRRWRQEKGMNWSNS